MPHLPALVVLALVASRAASAVVGTVSTTGAPLVALTRAVSMSAWLRIDARTRMCVSMGSGAGVHADMCAVPGSVTLDLYWQNNARAYSHAKWALPGPPPSGVTPPRWYHLAAAAPEQYNDTHHPPMMYAYGVRLAPDYVIPSDSTAEHPPLALPFPYASSDMASTVFYGGGATGTMWAWANNKAMAAFAADDGGPAPCAHPAMAWTVARMSEWTCAMHPHGQALYDATHCAGSSWPDACFNLTAPYMVVPPSSEHVALAHTGNVSDALCARIAFDCTGAPMGSAVYAGTPLCGHVCMSREDAADVGVSHPACVFAHVADPARVFAEQQPIDGDSVWLILVIVVMVCVIVVLVIVGVYFGTNRCDRHLVMRRAHALTRMHLALAGKDGKRSSDGWVVVGGNGDAHAEAAVDDGTDPYDNAEGGSVFAAAAAAAATEDAPPVPFLASLVRRVMHRGARKRHRSDAVEMSAHGDPATGAGDGGGEAPPAQLTTGMETVYDDGGGGGGGGLLGVGAADDDDGDMLPLDMDPAV